MEEVTCMHSWTRFAFRHSCGGLIDACGRGMALEDSRGMAHTRVHVCRVAKKTQSVVGAQSVYSNQRRGMQGVIATWVTDGNE